MNEYSKRRLEELIYITDNLQMAICPMELLKVICECQVSTINIINKRKEEGIQYERIRIALIACIEKYTAFLSDDEYIEMELIERVEPLLEKVLALITLPKEKMILDKAVIAEEIENNIYRELNELLED